MKKRDKKKPFQKRLSSKTRFYDKKAIVIPTLLYWIIGITILVIMLLFATVLKDKLFDMGNYIKNILRG